MDNYKFSYKELPYAPTSTVTECRRIEASNISMEQFEKLIQILYALPVVFEYVHSKRYYLVSFKATDKGSWNENTVTDGRTIGHVHVNELAASPI